MKQNQLNALNRSLSSSQRDSVAIPVDHLLDESNNGAYDNESAVTEVEATHVFAQALILGAVTGNSPQPNPGEIGPSSSHALNDQLPPLPFTDASAESARPKRRNRWQIGGIIVALFLVVAAISLGVTCGDGAPGCSQRRQQPDMGIENATQLPNTGVQPVGGPLPLPLSHAASLIVDYINNITLTGRKIELPATPFLNSNPEDLALRWLIYDDQQLNWSRRDDDASPSLSLINTFRVQQRYALTTMRIQNSEKFVNGSLLHECEWEGVTCQTVDRGSSLVHRQQ
jgi:hypothetical protein